MIPPVKDGIADGTSQRALATMQTVLWSAVEEQRRLLKLLAGSPMMAESRRAWNAAHPSVGAMFNAFVDDLAFFHAHGVWRPSPERYAAGCRV